MKMTSIELPKDMHVNTTFQNKKDIVSIPVGRNALGPLDFGNLIGRLQEESHLELSHNWIKFDSCYRNLANGLLVTANDANFAVPVTHTHKTCE